MINTLSSIMRNGVLTTSRGLSVYNRESVDVTFRTTEGDTVTLALQNQTKATYEHLLQANQKESLSSTNELDISTEEKFAVSVNGDLNDEEREDLSKALRVVEKMNREFLSGRGDRALASQVGFANLETIESVDSYFTLDRAINLSGCSSQTSAEEIKQGSSAHSAWMLLEALIRNMKAAPSSPSVEYPASSSQSAVSSTRPVALVA